MAPLPKVLLLRRPLSASPLSTQGAWACPHLSFAAPPAAHRKHHTRCRTRRQRTLQLQLRQAPVGSHLWHHRGHPTSQLHLVGQTRVINFHDLCQSAYRAHMHRKESMTRLTHLSSLCSKLQYRSPLVSFRRRIEMRTRALRTCMSCLTHRQRGSRTHPPRQTRPALLTLLLSSEAEVYSVTGTDRSLSSAPQAHRSVHMCPSSPQSLSAKAPASLVTWADPLDVVEASSA